MENDIPQEPLTLWNRRSLLGGMAAASIAGGISEKALAQSPFEAVLTSNVRIKMRDGVHLATDIYLPARDGRAVPGRYPVIMERTPYGRNIPLHRDFTAADPKVKTRADVAAIFVRHGYAVIFQDVRGRNGSEGAFIKYLKDGVDGYDTCSWIVEQPWCDGHIGTLGLSYAAHTQMALACLAAPGLKAMFLDCGGFSNAFQDGIRQGGAFELKQVTWAFNFGMASPEIQHDPARLRMMKSTDLKAWFASMPWKRGHTPLSAASEYEDYVYEQWEHGSFDDYWKQPGIYAEGFYDRIPQAAMVHMSGWYDPYSKTATDNFIALRPRMKRPVRLIMGPWTHGARSVTFSGDVEFGPTATIDAATGMDFFEYRRKWFDRQLKAQPATDTEPDVRIFVMGGGTGRRTAAGRMHHGGKWRIEKSWPLSDQRPTEFYLHASGELRTDAPSSAAERLTYRFDPNDPVPTIGGAVTSGEPLFAGGGYDQRETKESYGARLPYLPLDARPDVLVFQTAPLVEDMEITGAIEAHLSIRSDALDTDFTIKLIDLYPPNEDYPEGYALNLTDGILRCRYRDSWEQPSMMEPGRDYRIIVRAFPTSNLFKSGHRIRLDISSSNFPRFDVNPNTGGAEGIELDRRVAHNTVILGGTSPSHVVLPVIPRRG